MYVQTWEISFLESSFMFNDCKDLAGCFSTSAIWAKRVTFNFGNDENWLAF